MFSTYVYKSDSFVTRLANNSDDKLTQSLGTGQSSSQLLGGLGRGTSVQRTPISQPAFGSTASFGSPPSIGTNPNFGQGASFGSPPSIGTSTAMSVQR